MPVRFKDLLEAFELAGMSSGGVGETTVYVCRETGEIYWHFESLALDEQENDLPADIEDGQKYLTLPDKRELDLGKPLVLDFVRQFMPGDLDYVRDCFRRKGAYARFRALLARRGRINQWHDFADKAAARALREWCEDNSLDVID